jgi:hypothetical protein
VDLSVAEAGFSETQYAYGCVRELEEGGGLGVGLGPPIFPTLREEHAVGFDVLFRPEGWLFLPICFQFKVSEFLTTRRAKQWTRFRTPYFRFHVWPKSLSPQHNILVNLAKRGYPAYYCAPCFSTWDEYQNLYATGQLIEKSSLAWCGQFPTNTGRKWHSVSYADAQGVGCWSSEPQDLRIEHGRHGLEEGFLGTDLPLQPLSEVVAGLGSIYEVARPRVRVRTAHDLPDVSSRFVAIAAAARERYGHLVGLVFKSATSVGESQT